MLTSKIGTTRYVTISLCFVSVFIGMIVCLAYWHQRKGMVQEFFDLKDRLLQGKTIQKEHLQFWSSFDSFLTEVDQLQNTVEQQESILREDFLGKMLYGSYDSEKQLVSGAEKAGFPLEQGFYYVVDMEFEDPLRSGSNVSREEFSAILGQLLEQYIVWKCWRYSVSELSMVLLIQSEEELPAEELKKALEEMNYEFYSCLKVQSYTGISTAVQEPLEISRQYEIASRISEFARYRGIRVPVLPDELPKDQMLDQPLFVTIDMELKLVKQIQSGSAEQLEELIDQIKRSISGPETVSTPIVTRSRSCEAACSVAFRQIPKIRKSGDSGRLLKRFIWKNRFLHFCGRPEHSVPGCRRKRRGSGGSGQGKNLWLHRRKSGRCQSEFKCAVRMACRTGEKAV
ncbi:MAG: hypothetical protein ACLR6B_16685 [Blautia sp.]